MSVKDLWKRKEEKVSSQDVKQEGKAQKSEYLPWGCTRKGR